VHHSHISCSRAILYRPFGIFSAASSYPHIALALAIISKSHFRYTKILHNCSAGGMNCECGLGWTMVWFGPVRFGYPPVAHPKLCAAFVLVFISLFGSEKCMNIRENLQPGTGALLTELFLCGFGIQP